MNVNDRVTRVEEQIKNLDTSQRETRDELRQFRHDLFALINPLLTEIAGVKKDMEWMEKTKKWNPFLKLGSLTGLGAALAELWSLLVK